MGNQTGITNKKASTTSKNDKTEEKCKNILAQKEQSNASKNKLYNSKR